MLLKKIVFLFAACCLLLPASLALAEKAPPVLAVTGLVKQPLRLTMDQLANLSQVRVKFNDVNRKGDFHGVFWLRGVPLRNLLEMAQVEKEAGGYHKRVDLAVVVRGVDGRQVTLSWGEVFYSNPGETIIALNAQPVMPHKKCQACHQPDVYEPWMKQLDRTVGLPKLAVTGDYYADRSLENVASIEVVSLGATDWGPKMKKFFSPSMTVEGGGGKSVTLKKLPAIHRTQVNALQFGEGKGFHGNWQFGGVGLRGLVKHLKLPGGVNTVYLVSAPDGYRSLASWGELFLRPSGRQILLADREGGKTIEKGGRFELVFPGDLWADRWVKAVSRIQAVTLAPRARLFVIGMGCGNSKLLTLQAINALSEADTLVAPADIQKRFAFYMKGKPVLFDPMAFGKKPFNHKGVHKDKNARQVRAEEQTRAAAIIREQLAQGKSVAVLDWGDPMVYGAWRWLKDYFPMEQISFVPGLSAFNAGGAAVARDITCKGTVTISDPFTILAKPELVKSLAGNGTTLAIFMGMPKFKKVMTAVSKAYGPQTPVALVLKAGFGDRQKVLRGQLGQLDQLSARLKEKWLGVIFVGPCLK
jgi:precorrin-4 methylase